jgi:hypothetical protein
LKAMTIKLLLKSIFVLCFFGTVAISFAQEWREVGGDHFIVNYLDDQSFASEVCSKAEIYYQRIASDLGYPRYSEFWTWEHRVKIYIYPDKGSFINATHQPSWSEGMADYTKKQIISYTHSESFLTTILPHELAHLIFRDFVGFKGEVPLWLDEGVAQWAEPLKREKVKAVSKYLLKSDKFFSVEDMVNLDIRKIDSSSKTAVHSIPNEKGERHLLSLSGTEAVESFYVEAVSLVGFLIERYGAGTFTEFCRQLRDGKSLEDALRLTYLTQITSIEELESAWLEYLAQED